MSEFDQIGKQDYYAGQGLGPSTANTMAQMPTMRQRIDLAVKQAEQKLADTKRAKELFEKNPDLEELLNIMQRSHF